MTLKVSPEDLGPLTVRAHIDGAGVRIELFALGDTGREDLRGILPELRKELADAGFGASLDVSDHSGPPAGAGTQGRPQGREPADAKPPTPAAAAQAPAAGTGPNPGRDTVGMPWRTKPRSAPPGS